MIDSSYDYSTGKISSSIVEQAEQTFKNINAALIQAGSSMQDVVRVKYILPDTQEFPEIWPVTRKWLGEVGPAATMMECKLMKEEMKVEIEVTARKATGDKDED